MDFARIAALVTAFALAVPALAQNESPPQTPPRLVVAISVDQLGADLFAQYRRHFTGGFARLLEGAVFPSGYQAHAATETCPGHSTILTGAHPARSGIVANRWHDLDVARDDVRVYCAEDETVAGSSASDYTPSAMHLLVPTLGDLMKRANPASRVVAVAGKDRSAIMMGGHNADFAYWPGSAGFESYANATPPAALAGINELTVAAATEPRAAREVPAICAPYNRAIPIGEGQSVGTGRFARERGSARALMASPDADALTLAFAGELVAELGLGQGEAPDLLAVGLAATDYIGHSYGTEGVEMCVQMIALDGLLGEFFAGLDARGISYAVVLTADHGGLDLPERQIAQGAPDAARLTADFVAIAGEIAEASGLPAPVIRADGPFGDFYIDRSVPEERRAEIRDRAVAALTAHPQVYRVYAREEIMAQPVTDAPPEHWTVLDRVRASFHPDRSGDFVVVLQPRVTPIVDPIGSGYVATHGSVWDYDRRVPVVFWWNGARHFEQPLGVMTVDIMPTLASLIGLDISDVEIDGRCLDVMAGLTETNCP